VDHIAGDLAAPVAGEPSPDGADQIRRAALDVVGAVVMAADPGGAVRYFNRAAQELTGFDEADALGRSVWDFLIPPEQAPGARAAFAEVLAGGTPHRYENDWLTRDGDRRHISFVNTFLRDEDGRVRLVIGTGVDVTAERETQDLLEAIVNATTEQSVIATDLDGLITVFNTGAERMLGLPARETVGRNVAELLHDPGELRRRAAARPMRDGFAVLLSVVSDRGPDAGDWLYRRRDGSRLTVALSVTPLRLRDGPSRGYLFVGVDVTAQRRRERARDEAAEEAAHRAAHDPLTGLPNRAVLLDRLHRATAACRRHHRLTGLLYLDVDGLKTVNDRHGHAAGDALLIAVAHRLTESLREGDLCARLGGDEFAVLAEDLHDGAELDRVVERVQGLLTGSPVELPSGATASTAASIGSTVITGADADAQDVLARADAAMYRAKADRRAAPENNIRP
jgi:diguanylate cyclase (GGDEF)-like protein/PAS domain S-box-containing protein